MPPEARFTQKARKDLHDIAIHIGRESGDVEIANRFVNRFFERAASYADRPGAGSPAPGYRPGVRTFTVGKYLVFYRRRSFGIEVLKVIHGARNL